MQEDHVSFFAVWVSARSGGETMLLNECSIYVMEHIRPDLASLCGSVYEPAKIHETR